MIRFLIITFLLVSLNGVAQENNIDSLILSVADKIPKTVGDGEVWSGRTVRKVILHNHPNDLRAATLEQDYRGNCVPNKSDSSFPNLNLYSDSEFYPTEKKGLGEKHFMEMLYYNEIGFKTVEVWNDGLSHKLDLSDISKLVVRIDTQNLPTETFIEPVLITISEMNPRELDTYVIEDWSLGNDFILKSTVTALGICSEIEDEKNLFWILFREMNNRIKTVFHRKEKIIQDPQYVKDIPFSCKETDTSVIWGKRSYREVYDLPGENELKNLLLDSIFRNKLKVYGPEGFEVEKVKEENVDTFFALTKKTGEDTMIIRNYRYRDNFSHFLIVQDWFWDRAKKKLYNQVLAYAMAFAVYDDKENVRGHYIWWIIQE